MDIAQVDDPSPSRQHGTTVLSTRMAAWYAKRMAEALAVILRCRQARPLELIILVQVDAFGYPYATAGFNLSSMR